MKNLLTLTILFAIPACGGGSVPEKQYPGTPAPPETAHVVAQKIAPDTLIDQNGKFCIVIRNKFAGVDVGAVYDVCGWSARP